MLRTSPSSVALSQALKLGRKVNKGHLQMAESKVRARLFDSLSSWIGTRQRWCYWWVVNSLDRHLVAIKLALEMCFIWERGSFRWAWQDQSLCQVKSITLKKVVALEQLDFLCSDSILLTSIDRDKKRNSALSQRSSIMWPLKTSTKLILSQWEKSALLSLILCKCNRKVLMIRKQK